jgi:uncharacterized protein YndB with AHSA1/START domain
MSTMSLPETLPYRLDRAIVIHATPETVFRYFTDSVRWASWWGAGSTIDARPGGRVYIRHPGNVESEGTVLELSPPKRIAFSYGFVSGKPIPPGSSRVTIELAPIAAGTRLSLLHELADQAVRDEHVQGWRFQLSLFANVVADEVNADATAATDAWFAAWAEPDATARAAAFSTIATHDVRFQDRYSNLAGLEDLLPHIEAGKRFMPGVSMRRSGSVRHCQGMVLCDWIATGGDGKRLASGTNAFGFGPTGKIEWVTGFWSPPDASTA